MKTPKLDTIGNNEEYHQHLKKIHELMASDPAADSPEGRLLEAIAALIEDYERKQGWEIPTLLKH